MSSLFLQLFYVVQQIDAPSKLYLYSYTYKYCICLPTKSAADNSYLYNYDLYSPVHNVLDVCISITRASGRGLGQNPLPLACIQNIMHRAV
jgi:hypothetical protein